MDPILGQIILWAVPWVPAGWLLCDGTILSVNQYQALYSLLGNTYGGSPGVTFGLPDLRNRVPMGSQFMSAIAATAGSATSSVTAIGAGAATITINNLPSHTHAATFSPGGGTANVSIAIPAVVNPSAPSMSDTPGPNFRLAQVANANPDPVAIYSNDPVNTSLAPFTVAVPAGGGTVTLSNTGNGQPLPMQVTVPVTVSTLQPSLVLNYIIAVEGVYPSRP